MKQTFLYTTLKQHKSICRSLLLTECLRAFALLGVSGAAAIAMDRVFLGKESLPETAPVLLVLFLMFLVFYLLGQKQGNLLQRLSDDLRRDVRAKLHWGLLSARENTRRHLGRHLLPLALEATDALDAWFTRVLPVLAGLVISMPILLAAAFFVDPVTGLLMLVTVPIAPFLLYLIGRVTKEASQEQWRQMNTLSDGLAEILKALPTLKLFSQAENERSRVLLLSQNFAKAALHVLQLSFVSAFALELITTLAIAIIAVGIGLRLLYGQILFPAAFFVLLITPEFYQPLRRAGTAFHSGMTAFTAEQQLKTYTTPAADAGPEFPPPARAETSLPQNTAIAAKDLSFRYPGSPLPLWQHMNLEVKKGSLTVLKGPSGCGKTTLLRLMAGLLLPESGEISMAGQEKAGKISSYVPQEPHLFNATLAENVSLFQPSCSEAAIKEVLAAVSLADFCQSLPQGLHTQLGEGGQNLSQGQRKRLGVARALLQDRPLLLLDEPTAALDAASAKVIRQVLLSLRGTHTIFVVSHDPLLQAEADSCLSFYDLGGEVI